MPGRREFVLFASARKVSVRRACELVRVSRRRLGYVSGRKDDGMLAALKELAARHPRYGYRMLHQKLQRRGWKVNVKRVRRLCIKHGLTLRRKIRRKRRGIGVGMPCRAEYPNHVWAYDFVHDSCENGQKLKILSSPAVAWRLKSRRGSARPRSRRFYRACSTGMAPRRTSARTMAESSSPGA